MSSYTIQHAIYYDNVVQLLVCRRRSDRQVEFTRVGPPIDHNTDTDKLVADFFEGYQVTNVLRKGNAIEVTTLHTRVDMEA